MNEKIGTYQSLIINKKMYYMFFVIIIHPDTLYLFTYFFVFA